MIRSMVFKNLLTTLWRSYYKRENCYCRSYYKKGSRESLQRLLQGLGWIGGGLDWANDDGGWQGRLRFEIYSEHGIDRTS